MSESKVTNRELNRTLLARQGLLARWERRSVTDAVEAMGAIQSQNWAAVPVALWSRLAEFDAEDLYGALRDGRLVTGTLLRRTLHTVTARQHPEYAAAAEAFGALDWRRTKAPLAPEAAVRLRSALAEFAAGARSGAELAEFLDKWVAGNPGVLDEQEVAAQRAKEWRPVRTTCDLVRVPADGRTWSTTPQYQRAAPCPSFEPDAPDTDSAQQTLVRRHLAAFGPAGIDDLAYWLGAKVTQLRPVLKQLGDELRLYEDESGRTLYDLAALDTTPGRTAAPVRLLPAFDSTLLAYAPTRRERILPAAYRDLVYVKANLQVKPTILIDGLVAGTWEARATRKEAVLTVRLFAEPTAKHRAGLAEECEALARFTYPDAATHTVEMAG
ncbi:winged helix DNA-binding domain-containing protein [Streptomyces sp. NBC_00441]|uniref:winged helix DNA-binding domain-containing protein n=1 Tax=Streptomyces sp. NBC_00441 TaxID=2975742 RepID=UPI002E28AC27|nr:winged helix DNA-binding domain-containing protein [Streptomyces sp. NBC_00441]